MTTWQEIQDAINKFDPESIKSEDEEQKDVSIEDYQEAVNSVMEPEDLNFSMHDIEDADDPEDVESFPIPQKDADETPLKEGDRVIKVANPSFSGTVLRIGELVEVEWAENLITLEYPEELAHEEDKEQEEDNVHSLLNQTLEPIKSQDSQLEKDGV